MNILRRVTQLPTLKSAVILTTIRFTSFGHLTKYFVAYDFASFIIRGTRQKLLPLSYMHFLEYAYINKHRHAQTLCNLLYYDLNNNKQHRLASSRGVRERWRRSACGITGIIYEFNVKKDLGLKWSLDKIIKPMNFKRHMDFPPRIIRNSHARKQL